MSKTKRKAKTTPTVSIIGAGRLGAALALALTSSGYLVEALVSRRLKRAKDVGRQLPAGVLSLTGTQLASVPASKLILIATPDDVVSVVAENLAKSQAGAKQGRTVLHTSGALSSAVLRPLLEVGFHVGSIHPLVSVSEASSWATKLPGAFYCLEGDAVAMRMARAVVRDLGGHSFSISAADKSLYHAAAVMASGHMTALFDIAIEMLGACGLSGQRARKILLPLVKSAVANLASQEPARALTGTFARGDVATVRRHLAALSKASVAGVSLADALSAYRLLGMRSLTMMAKTKNGLEPVILRKIAKLLNDHALTRGG